MVTKKRKIPTGAKKERTYYCMLCNSYHNVGSKIGKEHFVRYFGWWQ